MFLNPEQLQRSNQYAQGLLDMSQGPVVGMLNQSYTGSGIGDAILAYLGDAVTGKNFQAGMDRLDQLAQMGITGDLPDEMPDIAYDMMPGGGVLSVGGRLAKTANLEMLDIAKDATEKGMSKEKIFDATGWWKGADDKWRFEIDDSAATVGDGVRKMKYSQYDNMRKLPEMLDNPNVRAAYPEYYDDIEVYKGAWGDDSMGSMSEQGYMMWLHPEVLTKAGRKSANRVMHHELNHGVSHQEGFARGGSTAEFGKELSKKKKRAGVAVTMVNDRLSNISKKMDRLREKMYDKGVNTVEVQREIDGLNNIYRELLEQRQSYVKDAQIDLLIDPYDSYRRLVDEVQARNVEHRLPLSADDRRMLPPWLTEDVPLEKQIVRFGDGDSMSTGILGDTLYMKN